MCFLEKQGTKRSQRHLSIFLLTLSMSEDRFFNHLQKMTTQFAQLQTAVWEQWDDTRIISHLSTVGLIPFVKLYRALFGEKSKKTVGIY